MDNPFGQPSLVVHWASPGGLALAITRAPVPIPDTASAQLSTAEENGRVLHCFLHPVDEHRDEHKRRFRCPCSAVVSVTQPFLFCGCALLPFVCALLFPVYADCDP